ncbi:sigma factor-like helix-turn-helix DNA-binding protein [Streptomyces sp. CAU 1734]|uniref:sigma factor-like helix-turn-helix DNA-binding protein n=1 Tax=Streptomyces sp. CAU 1734 TaxID=3140360 RepID=UPI00325FE244
MTQSTTHSAPDPPLPTPKERRRLREAKSMTEQEVAAAIGVTRATVRAWEAGRSDPRGRRREAYAKLLATPGRPGPDSGGAARVEPEQKAPDREESSAGVAGSGSPSAEECATGDGATAGGPEAVDAPSEPSVSAGPAGPPEPAAPSIPVRAIRAIRAARAAEQPERTRRTGQTELRTAAARTGEKGKQPHSVTRPATAAKRAARPAPPHPPKGSPPVVHPAQTAPQAPSARPGHPPHPAHPPHPSHPSHPAPLSEPSPQPSPERSGPSGPSGQTERTERTGQTAPRTAPSPKAAVKTAGGWDGWSEEIPGSEQGPTPAEAFDTLYTRTATALVRQAYLLTGRRRLSHEVVEHAFHLAWQRWPEVARDRDPVGWVRAAAYEFAMSPWQRLRPAHRHPDVPPLDPPRRALLDALLELPPPYRRALLLYDGLGLDLPETAAETEASTPATANRVLHAREAIAARLPELASAEALHTELVAIAGAWPAPRPAPAESVRLNSERRIWFWTRTALTVTALLIGATGFTLATAPTQYVPEVSPGSRVEGVPAHAGPEPLTDPGRELRRKLLSDPAHGPARLVPQIP